jgi:four helix bundle protein
MATARSFEELDVWKSARHLVKEIYTVTQAGAFAKDFGLRDQLRRAAVSIVSNIAEGFERTGNPEFIRFLGLAKGSAGEVRAQLYIALDLDYVSEGQFQNLSRQVSSISRQISALITYLEGFRTSPLRKTLTPKSSTLNL